MTSSITTYFGNKIIRWLMGEAMPTPPTQLYLGLYNGDPRTTGTEVTTSIRPAGRQAAPFDAVADNDQVQLTTSTDALFGASDSAETITHVTLHEDSTTTDILAVYQLAVASSVAIGQNVTFPSGSISFTVGSAT